MRKLGLKGLFMAFVATAVVFSGVSCGGGGAATGPGDGGGGVTTLRLQVVTYFAGQMTGIADARVYAVVGSGASATLVPFTPNRLDPTRYDLVNPPATITGLLVRPPQTSPPSFHRVVQYPALAFNDASNVYQMPDTVPYDTRLYAVPALTGPFARGLVDIGQAKLYPIGDPPPLPNFP